MTDNFQNLDILTTKKVNMVNVDPCTEKEHTLPLK